MDRLPPRLLAITEYIQKNDHVADIGSDHGLLPIYLAKKGVEYIYASENKKGPYNHLKTKIQSSGYSQIIVDMADGLDQLPMDVDTLVIAGMGGELIAKIISHGQIHLDHLKKMILLPHGNESELRQIVSYFGFSIQDEQVIEEDGKFYEVIYAMNQPCLVCGIESMFGPINIRKKTPTFIKKWQAEHDKIVDLLKDEKIPENRREELVALKKKIYDVITTKGDLQ